MDHATTSGDAALAGIPPELARLRSLWSGMYSITLLDGVWSAYYIRTGDELEIDPAAGRVTILNRD